MARPRREPGRHTRARIVQAALGLYNRLGEPNVSPNKVAGEVGISPGNLYYHFASKDALTQTLFETHERDMRALLATAAQVIDVEAAWFFLHRMAELMWQARFVYRSQNDLIGRSRWLEHHVKALIEAHLEAMRVMLEALHASAVLQLGAHAKPRLAQAMVVVQTYGLSFAYARAPRRALEPEAESQAVCHAAAQVLALLQPYARPPNAEHLEQLLGRYDALAT